MEIAQLKCSDGRLISYRYWIPKMERSIQFSIYFMVWQNTVSGIIALLNV